jgi:Disulphide bond corrector protein DsbC
LKNLFTGLLLAITVIVHAQNPVHWKYTAKKIDAKTYELHITATLDEGWHIYAMLQPASAISVPTKIVFTKNPLVLADGKLKELGKIEKQFIKEAGIEQNMLEKTVDYVQVIKLKASVKTSVNGTLTWQACTSEMCLPEKTIPFSITIP